MIQINKFLIFSIIFILSISTLNATIYENAEDGSINRWTIVDNDPTGAIVCNIYDADIASRVIKLHGSSYDNQYMIGDMPEQSGAWGETEEFHLLWSLKSSGGFLFDVILKTQNGIRYIRYRDSETDLGIEGDIINQGLGYSSANGEWHNFSRDLEEDLQEFEPNNSIISVDGIMIRGDCRVDNIELTDLIDLDFIVYEDAEDNLTTRWIISDNTPSGATISNIFDEDRESRVIELNSSDSYENQYQLGDTWNNQKHFNLKWDMKTTEGFIIDIVVSSTKGERYLRYIDNETSYKGQDDEIIYHGIGYHSTNGKWNSFTRDLQRDLQEVESNNTLLAVNSFLIRSKCRIDNIELFRNQTKVYEDAEDGESSRWSIYQGGAGATITNIYDEERDSRVISLQGNNYNHQYLIGGDGYNEGWGDTKHSNISWSMKSTGGFIIYLNVNTTDGFRYLKYSDSDFSQKGIDDDVIYYGLGNNSSNGKWHTFIRDIQADIEEFESNNRLLSVEGLIVVSSITIDDLELFNILHPVANRAGLTLTFDDHAVDTWYSMRDTYLEYGAKATFFLDKFHTLNNKEIKKLKTLEKDGHEIGCHTYSHKGIGRDFDYNTSRIDEYIQEQIVPALNNMHNAGFKPTSIAYPYGEHEKSYDDAVRAYLPYLRITDSDSSRELYELHEIYHNEKKHYKILAGDGIDNSYDNEIDEIRDAFIKARKNGEIITLYGHKVVDDDNDPYAVSHEKIEQIVESAKEMGLKFYTFAEAYQVGNK